MQKGFPNIVVFGPNHCGKSTLAGYFLYTEIDEIKRKNYISKLEINLGKDYDHKQKFAYFIDTRKDEQHRTHDDMGTSKHMKDIFIQNKNFRVIDTPGLESLRKERLKGIFYGDVGLFMIPVKDVPQEGDKFLTDKGADELKQIFTPLNTWLKFKNKNKLLIVLSKMDITKQLPFSEKEYEVVSKNIKWFVGLDSVQIIPISIEVDKELSHNVLERSSYLPWYKGPTLLEAINNLISQKQDNDIDEKTLLIYVDKEYDEVKGFSKILKGKILQGILEKNSLIKISPLEYSKSSTLVTVSGHIKTIQILETQKDEDFAMTGDIAKFSLHNISYRNRIINPKDLGIVKTTCVFDSRQDLLEGNRLIFEVNSDELKDITLSHNIMILWFGRLISCKVIQTSSLEKTTLITTELDGNLKVALPIDENNKLLIDNFLLEIHFPSIHSTLPNYKYIKAVLKKVEEG